MDSHRRLGGVFVLVLFLAGCGGGAKVPVPVVDSPEFTFFVAADTHYGLTLWEDNESSNKATIDRMNALPGTAYPPETGLGPVAAPVGVLVAGDLTDAGAYGDWHGYWFFGRHEAFAADYGLGGEGRLHYPVFEGYGNHDLTNGRRTVTKAIAARNGRRSGLSLSGNGLHSSWDWGPVHFVNLNLYPGDTGDAKNSLDFLKADLATRVGNSGGAVVLFHHYGFDSFSTDGDWWQETEREAYYAVIQPYNVVAIFNGHLHEQGHRQWHGLDAYTAGKTADGCFLVVHIAGDTLVVAARTSEGWGPCWTKPLSQKTPTMAVRR